MAHNERIAPVRTHRMFQYGSLTGFALHLILHHPKKVLGSLQIKQSVIANS